MTAQRRRARQDLARNPRLRDGGAGGGAVRTLLRQCRFHAAASSGWLRPWLSERTGDEETIRALWPNIEAALTWIDKYGDRDGDGFVEYYRVSENGLTNQGWKDSCDSIMHADGQLAPGSIALCEVQAYVYAAQKGAAMMAAALGQESRASELAIAAEKLRVRFEAAFWVEELGTYALALDGDKKPCKVRSSNAGQVLASGHAAPDRAQRVAAHPDDAGNVLGLGRAYAGPRMRRASILCPITMARSGRTTMP